MWELMEFKTSIGWQLMEHLLVINGCRRRRGAKFGEGKKTPQNILTGKASTSSMWLCWQFSALSVVSTHF